MSDPINESEDASPGGEPTRQLDLPASATMIQQGGAMVHPEMLMRVEAELEPGERLLWTGRPRRWQIPSTVALPSVSWGTILTWVGCYLFYWGATGYHPLIGTSMGCIATACGLVVLHTLVRVARKNDRTIYAITNRRALILNAGRELTVRSFQPRDIGAIHLRQCLHFGAGYPIRIYTN